MNEYEKQANDFLTKTKTEFKAEFLRHGVYFDDDFDDDVERDIYEITLKRGEREFKFEFGQSIANSGIKLKPRGREIKADFITDDLRRDMINLSSFELKKRSGLKFRFAYNMRQFVFPIANYKEIYFGDKPTAYDVLACLTTSEVGKFEDFCLDYGYSNDSIKAQKTYKAVLNEFNNLKMIYSAKELNLLGEIC